MDTFIAVHLVIERLKSKRNIFNPFKTDEICLLFEETKCTECVEKNETNLKKCNNIYVLI